MTNMQSPLAAQLAASLGQLRIANPPDGEKVSQALVQINDAADLGKISIKEWRELIVMASHVRRNVRTPAPTAD